MFNHFTFNWPVSARIRRFIIFSLVFLVIGLLAVIYFFGLTGRVIYSRSWPFRIGLGQAMISDFEPRDNFSAPSASALKVKAEPLLFSVRAPREFKQALVTIKYNDHLASNAPLIELGLLRRDLSEAYDFKELQNTFLDQLKFSWHRLEDSADRLVLQRGKNYSSLDSFVKDLQSNRLIGCPGQLAECLATVNYPVVIAYNPPSYLSQLPLSIKQTLVGSQELYIYLTKEPWRLAVEFSRPDLKSQSNQNIQNSQSSQNNLELSKNIVVRLFDGDKLITEGKLARVALGVDNSGRQIILSGSGLKPGAYRVEIEAGDGVLIKEIQSSSPKLVFINRLKLVAASSTPLFTDSADILSKTPSGEAAILEFNNQRKSLSSNYQRFNLAAEPAESGVHSLKLSGSATLAGKGVWSFTPASFFNPRIKSLDYSLGSDWEYLMADYQLPTGDKEARTAQVKFDLTKASYQDGRYHFLLAIPGLTGQDQSSYLEIQALAVAFTD